jgi:hypothetical protein
MKANTYIQFLNDDELEVTESKGELKKMVNNSTNDFITLHRIVKVTRYSRKSPEDKHEKTEEIIEKEIVINKKLITKFEAIENHQK